MKTVKNFVSPEHEMFKESVRSFLPRYAIIPFKQTDGTEYTSPLREGDIVREGQILAGPKDILSSDGANIHSSVPGLVEEIVNCTLPNGNLGLAAKIRTRGAFSYLGKELTTFENNILSIESLLESFKTKGVVNTFETNAVSLSNQINSCKLESNRFVVVRMFDEDKSRYTDTFIAEHYTQEVAEGARIIARAFDADGIIFAIPKDSNTNIKPIEGFPYCIIEIDTSKYPCGYKQNLLKEIKKSTVTDELSIFSKINHRSLFVDTETAFSAYEAIVLNKPVVDRFVHINGRCVKSSVMFRARIGQTIADLVEQCGGFRITPAKIVINGLIAGNAISNLEIPVTKEIKSVTFLSSMELYNQKSNPCVRCGNCRMVCPEQLSPDLLYKHINAGFHLTKMMKATALLCAQCSLCNSVCPSRLSLSQTIAILKESQK